MNKHMSMKIIMVLLCLVCSVSYSYSQENVIYLNKTPMLDGKRDDFIQDSHFHKFKDIYLNGEKQSYSGASYILGYTLHHLYIYIEAEADSITCRDRAYQNGDGFHLTLGMAKDDKSDTDEFHVLGFSPSDDWTRKIRWYYNVGLSMKRLGEDVLFETHAGNGTAGFEVLIPWNAVIPYHPWVYNNIGFNLCFVKAVNEHDKIYHFIKTDWRMQSEQSKRKYVNLTFEEPQNHYGFYAMPARMNYTTGDTLEIKIAGYASEQEKESFQVKVLSENETVHSESIEVELKKGFSDNNYKLNFINPEAGAYTIEVSYDQNGTGKGLITVFEAYDSNELHDLLAGSKSWISQGTYSTLLYYIDELEKERSKLKHYEASPAVSLKIKELIGIRECLIKQTDPMCSKRGLFRRAFLSDIDQTLRPYSVYIPEEYNSQKVYPLLVYLHGSGQDDRALFTTNFIKNDFIVLAPNGRGTSNCYSTAEALTDIREAIADVQKNYNIDTSKIILSGFSMGGYGVYRSFYEYPELFCAAAVLSGHPNLAGVWGAPDSVNFLDPNVIPEFADIPFFIYHGEQDQNCPFELTYKFVSQLKRHNKEVVFIKDEKAGHNSMNEYNMEKYHEWLTKIVTD